MTAQTNDDKDEGEVLLKCTALTQQGDKLLYVTDKRESQRKTVEGCLPSQTPVLSPSSAIRQLPWMQRKR